MRYVYDHDFHIHSKLSGCSNDPLQSNERILKYAEDNGLKKIVLTDHYWDENIKLKFPSAYANSNTPYIKQALPLPQGKQTQFLFGAESDMDMTKTIGVSKERFNEFDFVIIPTTHLHFKGFTISEEDAASVERIAKLWVERFNALLNMDLPFKKMGIAHLVCALIAPSSREGLIEVLNLLPENELKRLFSKAAEVGIGIELNYSDMSFSEQEAEAILRPFQIAKQQNCKFYLGSDAHHPNTFEDTKRIFERAIDYLELKEKDKFIL